MPILLSNISKSYGARVLFDDVNAAFHDNHRYGLTGPNGAGKSTLLKIIMQTEEATRGSVTLPSKVGILKQNIEDFKDCKVLDAVIMGNKRLWQTFVERDHLYEQEMTDAVGLRLGELEEIIAEEDGYSAESNAEVLLQGMSIPQEWYQEPMHVLPTDKQFCVLLCQALFGDPQALLLDEPTNHLDLESIAWLEAFLKSYKGILLVISHDRHFLNAVTTDIADIDYETVIIYPGNYDDMVAAKTAVREREVEDIKNREKKIAHLQEFVSKFRSGTRASQVQSRMKEIEKLQPQDLKKSNIQRPYIRFTPSAQGPGRIALTAHHLSKAYGDNEVLKKLSLEVSRGDKIGVIGNNGRGKTTLMKLLAGHLTADKGRVEYGHNVQICYFPQNHGELIDKNDSSNGFEWLRARKEGVNDQDIRSAMGKMLFSGPDAFKQVNHLSGGESARLILAGMMLTDHNVLLLDEPNGHLDLESVSALAWGLQNYPETVIVVSHDRDLIGKVATKILAFEEDGVHFYHGDLESYWQSRAGGK